MRIPVCDTCGGHKFHHSRVGVKPKFISASEYFKNYGEPRAVPAILHYDNYVAKCECCGAEYKYTLVH